jgi:hypothetical protein
MSVAFKQTHVGRKNHRTGIRENGHTVNAGGRKTGWQVAPTAVTVPQTVRANKEVAP